MFPKLETLFFVILFSVGFFKLTHNVLPLPEGGDFEVHLRRINQAQIRLRRTQSLI